MLFIIVFPLLLSFFFIDYINDGYLLSSFALVFIIIFNMYRSRNETVVFLFLFFNLLFPIDLIVSSGLNVPLYPGFILSNLNLVIFIHFIFFLIFLIFNRNNSFCFPEIRLNQVVVVLFIAPVLIYLTSLHGVSILASDSAYADYQSNLSEGSGLIEYSLMVLFACSLVKVNRFIKAFLVFVLLFYVYKTINLGFRVQAIIGLIILCFSVYKINLSPLKNLFFCVISYFLGLIYGFVKEGLTLDKILEIGIVDDRYGYWQSHQAGVLSSATIMLNYYDHFFNSYFLKYVGVLLGSFSTPNFVSLFAPETYPSRFVQNFQYTPGGGLFSTQAFLVFGSIGFILFSISICYILFNNKGNLYLKIVASTLLVFFPRWVSYDLVNYGVRTSVYVLFIVLIMSIISSLISRANYE